MTVAFDRARGRETRGGGGMRERERGAGRHGDFQGGQSDEEGKQEVAGRVAAAGCGAGTQLLGRGGGR